MPGNGLNEEVAMYLVAKVFKEAALYKERQKAQEEKEQKKAQEDKEQKKVQPNKSYRSKL